MERDIRGKQIRRYTTWTPPEGLTPSKAKKAAERAADLWEEETKAEYQKEKEAAANGQAYSIPPEKRRDDFVSFVEDTWLPLQVRGGNDKPTTVDFYQHMAKTITNYFNGAVLQEIGPLDIQKYLVYLRTEYKSKLGKPLSPKSLRHQYGTLNLIFGYAEKQEMIAKNPMKKVDAPKKEKMYQLYQQLGTFKAVAKKMHRDPGTVSRHIHEYEAAMNRGLIHYCSC